MTDDEIADDIGGRIGELARELMELSRWLHVQSVPYIEASETGWTPDLAIKMSNYSRAVADVVNVLIDEWGTAYPCYSPVRCDDCEVHWCANHERDEREDNG